MSEDLACEVPDTSVTPTDRVASDRVREALVRCIDEAGAGATFSLAEALGVETDGGWDALHLRIADALLRAECGADTARVVQIINSLDNVKPDGDAVSRYELLQAIEEAIRDD